MLKIKDIDNSYEDVFVALDNDDGTLESLIINVSDNPIDLIEVGDYVNGCYVDEIISANDSWDDRKHFHLLNFISYFDEGDIKSIVTKEQFNFVKYEVR